MAFKLGDFKKTTRGQGEARQLYPYQIRDDRYTAAIGYAVGYFERMVGRRRAEFEADALLEFFGDPRLARGLVACLADTYTWRSPELAEALGEPAAHLLLRAGVTKPSHLRARLYELANERYGGFIAQPDRAAALEELGRRLAEAAGEQRPGAARRLASQVERALTLDSDSEQILVKRGPTPTPDRIVARYNYHSVETALGQAEEVQLTLRGPVWTLLSSAHNLARRYRVGYDVGAHPRSLFDERLDLRLLGQRDAFGSWGRVGRRLVRVILRLLASHPGAVQEGAAVVHIGGKRATVKLDERALRQLGAVWPEAEGDEGAWEEALLEELRRAWGRALVGGRAAGWRLRRDPDPLVGGATLVAPDFSLRRGQQSVALCLAASRSAAESLAARLRRLGPTAQAVVLASEQAAPALRGCGVPVATYAGKLAEGLPRLVAQLERAHPRGAGLPAPTPWQTIERRISDDGFVDEATVADILGCPPAEAAALVRRWGGPGLHALPGLGVCDGETLEELREILDRAA